MRQQSIQADRLLRACLAFLVLSLSFPAVAEITPKPGSYCPGKDILLVVAEELSASLNLSMHSRTALINKDQITAINTLDSAGTTLRLAASRGAAARTTLLIDSIIEAGPGESYAQMLSWFPLLHTSLLTLPDDATASAAENLIGRAEDSMQTENGKNPVKLLREARHLLTCDGLDIPLQAAIQAQIKLMKQLVPRTPAKNSDYDALFDSLRNALTYTLNNSQM
ncbi:hypothetical protein MNBD_GAMMA15-472 [hydrothermal vent metagenome]|uniref:Uncharacterized protein n=1 Tax=hydrothermal vent metagenome TaxID=652676 RepID=A0A3B0YUW5_9ZZZZ